MALVCLFILIAAGVMTVGLWGGGFLCCLGIAGRPTDDHPHCARCDYDFTGHLPYPKRCPECGNAIGGAGSVRIGALRPHPGLIASGFAAMVVSLLPLTPVADAVGEGIRWALPGTEAAPTQPPLTGGMSAIVQPSRSGEASDAYAPSRATASDARDRAMGS
jgi:hypothetical protein